jgi:pyrroloquinoline quinone biosynthesis protein B
MKIRILGSAAGGGFPQWNCNCRNCRGVREGGVRATPRTQSSIAVCGRVTERWALVNASPDVLQQLRSNPRLQPGRALRDTAVAGIVLLDGQIDHVAGLLMLREAANTWPLWCTDAVRDELTGELPLLKVLSHYCGVEHRSIDSERAFAVDDIDNVEWRALSLQSKPPPYSRDRTLPRAGSNVALTIRDLQSKRTALYAPGVGAIDASLWEAMQRADLVLIDGTCWTDDELPRLGISRRTARDMGHLAIHGEGGMLEWLDRLPTTTRKVLVHINNTNPILDEDSPERALLSAHGVIVAEDGMEWEL